MGIRLERAAGPLAEHRAGYQAELERLGYTRDTVKQHLVVVGQLDRYLLAEGAALGAVDEVLIGRFVAARTEENLAVLLRKITVISEEPRVSQSAMSVM
jgi:hypothetical protein